MENNHQTTLLVLVSVLKQAKKIDCISTVISIMALLLFITSSLVDDEKTLLIISPALLIVGFIEKYYAIRLSIDKDLFAGIALSDKPLTESLEQLDHALVNLKLIKQNPPNRNLENRQQGAMRLLKKQLFCCLLQIILLLSIPFVV